MSKLSDVDSSLNRKLTKNQPFSYGLPVTVPVFGDIIGYVDSIGSYMWKKIQCSDNDQAIDVVLEAGDARWPVSWVASIGVNVCQCSAF